MCQDDFPVEGQSAGMDCMVLVDMVVEVAAAAVDNLMVDYTVIEH